MLKNLGWNKKTGASLIAPCGMNCGICVAYLRDKNPCPGCRIENSSKPVTRADCKIKNCTLLKTTHSTYCYECGEYPCKPLKHLDKRYRTRYKMSMIENLNNLQSIGIESFLRSERERWRCPLCGGVICVHKGYCLTCK